METAATPGSAATSGLVPYCQMTASKSSSVRGEGASAGPTAVAQRRVTPSGVARDPHGEAGDHEVAPPWRPEGERAERHDAGAGALDACRRTGWTPALRRPRPPATSCAVPQPTSVRPGRSNSTVGLAVELQRVGPVVERHAPRRGARPRRAHGAPARVATTSWLRPPARGRIPTAEKPASTSIRRRTAAGGR